MCRGLVYSLSYAWVFSLSRQLTPNMNQAGLILLPEHSFSSQAFLQSFCMDNMLSWFAADLMLADCLLSMVQLNLIVHWSSHDDHFTSYAADARYFFSSSGLDHQESSPLLVLIIRNLLLFWSESSGIFSSFILHHQESSPLLVFIIRNLLLFYSSSSGIFSSFGLHHHHQKSPLGFHDPPGFQDMSGRVPNP